MSIKRKNIGGIVIGDRCTGYALMLVCVVVYTVISSFGGKNACKFDYALYRQNMHAHIKTETHRHAKLDIIQNIL